MLPTNNKSRLNARHVRRRFDRAAASFDGADFVHELTRTNLLQRLLPVVIEAGTVLDLGSATGSSTSPLAKRFQKARIVSVDISHPMLVAGRRKQGWFRKAAAVQADASLLPFADHSVDVAFANLLLPWIDDPRSFFLELSRVLRKGGLFSFATLGPDSLAVLREAWESVDPGNQHVLRFADMHEVGDGLVQAGLIDPVLDVDRLTVSYPSVTGLFRDLSAAGARNCLSARKKSLSGKKRFEAMQAALAHSMTDDKINVGLEIVYGHCWGSGQTTASGEFRVDASQIAHRNTIQ